jgi:sulfite reductase (ferredoxin)
LDDFEKNGNEGEYFNDYFARQGKNYFYTLLKPLGVITELTQDLLVDWGNTENYETAVGVGECAGVLVDMVQVLLDEQRERLNRSDEAFANANYADAIYHCYNTFVNGAKALLLSRDVQCNTQHGIMNDFDKNFVETGEIAFKEGGFRATVLLINQNDPTEEFAKFFRKEAEGFLQTVSEIRKKQVANA